MSVRTVVLGLAPIYLVTKNREKSERTARMDAHRRQVDDLELSDSNDSTHTRTLIRESIRTLETDD